MKRLPFVTEPKAVETVRVGNSEIGEIEIAKLEDLSPNERTFLREQCKSLPDLKREAVKLAQVIATQINLTVVEVYSALTNGDTETLANHLGEVIDFQEKMEFVAESRQTILATLILRFRVMKGSEWTLEDTGNADLIHPELVTAIAQFAAKEESGWAVAIEQHELTEEALGNS